MQSKQSERLAVCEADISYCPKCGCDSFKARGDKSYLCSECGFIYYHNAAAATVAIIRCESDILMSVRGCEPYRGMLDLPGGFQEYGESFEEGIKRELEEEIGITIKSPKYLFSLPNIYPYNGVVYHSSDAYFEVVFDAKPIVKAGDDVSDLKWVDMESIDYEQIAFDSMKEALRRYISYL